ncbi:MAG: AMP-binding protein [Nocardioidaceae bacterium]
MKVRIPATNVADLLERCADRSPEKVGLIDGGANTTWRDLDEQVSSLSHGLAKRGLVAGHRVAIALVNSTQFVATYLAVLRAGMVAVPVNPTSTMGEIARMLGDSGSRVCVADSVTVDSVRTAVASLAEAAESADDGVSRGVVPHIVVSGAPALPDETSYHAWGIPGPAVSTPRDTESLAVLLYTTGTSGRPRAAMLSHRALLANIDQASQTRPPPIVSDDVVLGVLPLFHVYGLNAVLGQVLLQGATLVIGRRFSPGETLRLIEAEQVTCVPVAPPVIAAWMQGDHADSVTEKLTSVRLLLSGAAPLAEGVVREFESRTGVAVEQGYGLTEAAPIVTSTIGTGKHKPGSAGHALPGVELRVVDDAGRDVHADDPGEIWVRGRNLFSGYWPDGGGAPTQDGWLATGDIGFLDADGDLFMVDRLKELVIVSGFNVYPSEIEDVIDEVDGVKECAVIGVPNERTGEAVVAYVVPADGVDGQALAETVKAHCVLRVARFKVPSSIEVVNELPHSVTGKVAKGRLRAAEARRAIGLS